MKTLLFFTYLLFSFYGTAQDFNTEQKNIIQLIRTSYAEGLQNEGDTVKIDAGFHPDFYLLGIGTETELRKLAIKAWRDKQIENRGNGKLPRKAENIVSLSFEFIDITGDVAVAKINYIEGEKRTFVDYISLYRYESGWKIVSKVYQKM